MDEQVDLLEENRVLKQEVAYLREELSQMKRLIFGSKRERFIATDTTQQSIFEEESVADPKKETLTYQRNKPTKKSKAKRLLLSESLPRDEQVILPEGVDPENSIKIGEKISEVLEYTPGKLYVTRTVRPVYKQADESIVVADLPTQVIPNGNALASLLSYL